MGRIHRLKRDMELQRKLIGKPQQNRIIAADDMLVLVIPNGRDKFGCVVGLVFFEKKTLRRNRADNG